jgi:hypothetical protein
MMQYLAQGFVQPFSHRLYTPTPNRLPLAFPTMHHDPTLQQHDLELCQPFACPHAHGRQGNLEHKEETKPATVIAPTSTPAPHLCHPSLTRSLADLSVVPSHHSVACPARREHPGAGLAFPAACTKNWSTPCSHQHGTAPELPPCQQRASSCTTPSIVGIEHLQVQN